MNVYFLPGAVGILLGMLLRWTGFSQAEQTRTALALRRGDSPRYQPLRSAFTALGWGMILTALLCWLAVIDVDTIEVLPLSLGALAGGALMGIAAGLCGATPTSAFAMLGAGHALEALCILAGCWTMVELLPAAEAALSPLRSASPYLSATLFRVTLDEPWIADGGFLGHACTGAVLAAIGVCIPARRHSECEMHNAELEAETPAESPDPEAAQEETFVALLEGEEPLVVDTAAEDAENSEEEG